MKTLILAVLSGWLLTLGCAASASPQRAEPYYPYISDLPPSYYDYDPALRGWFTAPYWNPDIGP